MQYALALSSRIDQTLAWVGKTVAWLIVIAAFISAGNAVIRKLFDASSNAWLEAQWWLFAAAFLLAAPWTLAKNEHIRIDIVNTRLSLRKRDWIELIGHTLFLLPMCLLVVWTSWSFFWTSYGQNEQSLNAGGLPQWPVKAVIPIAFTFLALQGVSEIIKRIAIMTGHLDREDPHDTYHAEAVSSGSSSAPK